MMNKSFVGPGKVRGHSGDFRQLRFKKRNLISYFYPALQCLQNTNVWTLCVAIEYSEMCLREAVKKISIEFPIEEFCVESGIQQKENYFWTIQKTIYRNYLKTGKHWIEHLHLLYFLKSSLMLCRVILMSDISGTWTSLYLAMAWPGSAPPASRNKIS